MEQLSLKACLGINPPAAVAFYGAGGKTTLLYRLAAEMTAVGHKVLLTTTTKILLNPDLPLYIGNNLAKVLQLLKDHYKTDNLALLGRQVLPGKKIDGIDPEWINLLMSELRVTILIEADGSRGLPLKGFAPYEPVIPASTDLIIAVTGADAIGSLLNEQNVHRLPFFLAATDTKENTPVSAETVVSAYRQMLEIGHKQAPQAVSFCLINKADLLENRGQLALTVAAGLSGTDLTCSRLLLTRGNRPNPVLVNLGLHNDKGRPSVACVLLAAGTSSRMGSDKLALPFGGKTILEHTIAQAAGSGFDEIIIVTRPGSRLPFVQSPYRIKIVENSDYRKGLSASVKKGLTTVQNSTQGVLFALADQPLVSSETYSAILDSYRKKLKAVTCPVYRGKRGNPTLFDRAIWMEMMNLSGDQGGRAIIDGLPRQKVDFVELDSPEILTDIDTPDDYRMLIHTPDDQDQ